MNPFIYSAFVVFVFSFIIGISFARKKNKTPAVRFFGFFWLTIAFWTYFVFYQAELLKQLPDFWWGLFLHLGCIYVPLVYFHFALHLTGNRQTYDWVLKIGYGFMGLFLLLIATSDLFTAEIVYRDDYAYPRPSVLYPMYVIFFQVFGFFGAFLIYQWAVKLKKETRKRVHYFLLLQILAHAGAMDNFLIMYDIQWFPLYPYGLYFILPYAVFGSRIFKHVTAE